METRNALAIHAMLPTPDLPTTAVSRSVRPLNPMSEPVTEQELHDSADDVLIARVQTGDHRAFHHLVRRHQERIRNLLFAMFREHELVDDLAQEVFIKAYEALPGFRFESSFYTWLYRIAVNKGRDELRRRKLRRFFSLQHLDDNVRADLEARIAERPHDLEATDLVALGLRTLPDHQREVIIMKDLQGFSYEEIAEILDVEVGTVKSRLSRARTAMRNVLGPLLREDTP